MLNTTIGTTGKYNTGRIYDCPQVLAWEIVKVTPIELDMCILSVSFEDKARYITGRSSIFVDIYASKFEIGLELLRSYDDGSYTAI